MRYKLSFAVGVAVGFVLGARAGRERYDQIVRTAQSFIESPSVQETAGLVGAKATDFVGKTGRKVTDKVGSKLPFGNHHDDYTPPNGSSGSKN